MDYERKKYKQVKSDYQALFKAIRQILLEEDPTGIYAEANPDEYDPGISHIMPHLKACRNADQSKLTGTVMQAISSYADSLFVSAITAFEIAIKHRQQKLTLPLPPLQWYTEVVTFHGIHELPVTGSIAMMSVQLPSLHNDPCDRIIIATAETNGLSIVTCDKLIAQYPQAKILW